jgi:hypothetical protein
MSAFTDKLSARIDNIAKPAIASSFKAAPPPASAVAMAKAVIVARETTVSKSSMAFAVAGGVMLNWTTPAVALMFDTSGATIVDIRSGKAVKTVYAAIDATFYAAFDALFVVAPVAPAVAS